MRMIRQFRVARSLLGLVAFLFQAEYAAGQTDPNEADAYLAQGIAHARRGQYDEAIALYDKALRVNPRHPGVFNARGIAFASTGRLELAITQFNHALGLNPRLAPAYNNRGTAYSQMGQFDQAIADYGEAIKINPRYGRAYSGRARVFYLKKEYERAWEDVDRARGLGVDVEPRILKALSEVSGREPQSLPALIKHIQPAVVTIAVRNRAGATVPVGSGFFVSDDGHVITNEHVLRAAMQSTVAERGSQPEVLVSEGDAYALLRVVAEDKDADLAWVAASIPRGVAVKALRLSQVTPQAGERVLVIGSPFGLRGTASHGIVSAVRGKGGAVIQITASISPGSSGSPVLNMRGEVIGVAKGGIVGGQNLNFAVAAERVLRLMQGR